MPSRLQTEIHQEKPFASVEEEALLCIVRAGDQVTRALETFLKPYGLTSTQYNVLRILRGAGARGVACGQIAERMITRDPDITRLLDRLEARQLAERFRNPHDRRLVLSRITSAGEMALAEIDAPMKLFHRTQAGRLGTARLRQLVSLLEELI